MVAAGIGGAAFVIATVVSVINFVLMSLVFEAGILIGSAAVAAASTCRRP